MGALAVGISAKDEAVAFLQTQGSRMQHQRPGSARSALDAVVTRQGKAEFERPPADFHLIELCLSGSCTGRRLFDGLAGPADCRYRPGALFAIPAGRAAQVSIRDGEATILQLMIDRAVMDEVKRAMLRGDADRVELLGFNAVFDARMRACALAIHRELRHPSAGGALVADVMAEALLRNP
ncbi:hypothetical protein [Rubellimicrobium roseum]|nr:hypothetical protein [Rubellimicrobium roseum]